MPKTLKYLYLLSPLFLISAALSAQSNPAAEGPRVSVWAGAEFSTFNPDYGCADSSPFSCGSTQLLGITPFVDANHVLFQRLGAEAEARFLQWRGPGSGLTEASYLAGPRIDLLHFKRRLVLSGMLLLGDGHLSIPKGAGNGSYFAYAPGAVVDFRATRRISARVGYEYQIWPLFKGVPTSTTTGTGGLTPNGFSFGLSYAILK
jgi:hypothetical protein